MNYIKVFYSMKIFSDDIFRYRNVSTFWKTILLYRNFTSLIDEMKLSSIKYSYEIELSSIKLRGVLMDL